MIRDLSWSPECSETFYSRFFDEGDTLYTTVARAPESCNEFARFIWRPASDSDYGVVQSPIYDWNIEAIWYTGEYIVFGLHASYEYGSQRDRLAFWNVETGNWRHSPRRNSLVHRPGFDLPGFLPEWRVADVSVIDDAIILRGTERALAFWPESGSWSLLDASSGQPILPEESAVDRNLIANPHKIATEALITSLLHQMKDFDTAANGIGIVEAVNQPCTEYKSLTAIIATTLETQPDTSRNNPFFAGDYFGVFLVDTTLTTVVKSIDIFPNPRRDDYLVYFDLEAPDDSLIVYVDGATYGHTELRRAYECGR
jgi:hypothetical protein